MTFIHGRHTVITLDGDDLSAFTKQSELTREADTHDVTAYGASSHAYVPGLLDGSASMSGTYDDDIKRI